MNQPNTSVLPYRDEKPVGAADFYFAINATFRFIRRHRGDAGLRRYWANLGERYMAPVTELWRQGGLPAVAAYWRDFFAAEPGGDVVVYEEADRVRLEVRECPAIRHLREHGREIEPVFCQHCYFVSEAAGRGAGLTVRVEGGGGSCRQKFLRANASIEPQELTEIRLVGRLSEGSEGHAGGL
jgi:hypothetical protein